jgi:hypothetical protein
MLEESDSNEADDTNQAGPSSLNTVRDDPDGGIIFTARHPGGGKKNK